VQPTFPVQHRCNARKAGERRRVCKPFGKIAQGYIGERSGGCEWECFWQICPKHFLQLKSGYAAGVRDGVTRCCYSGVTRRSGRLVTLAVLPKSLRQWVRRANKGSAKLPYLFYRFQNVTSRTAAGCNR